MNFDSLLFTTLHSLAGKNGFLDAFGAFVADYGGYFVVLAAIIFFFTLARDWRSRVTSGALIVLALLIARGIVTPLLKFMVNRPRPYETLGFTPLLTSLDSSAFPSGHAAFFFALGTGIFFVNRRAGWWFLAAAFLIGLARVFVGVHWPTDILGGALIGIASAFLVREMLKEKRQ